MQQPQIGVTVLKHKPDGYKNYLQRIHEAGGIPVELAPEDLEAAGKSGGIDGLLLTGGGDVDPARYGAERRPETDGVHAELDQLELSLVRLARERSLPILAICRGHQLLNVAFGGSLLQHIEGDAHRAHQTEGYPSRSHPVRIEPDSRLHDLLGADQVTVNSRHHQAVLPEMVAPGLRPTAYSPDGLVEAMESVDGAWVTSVQWHPERPEPELTGFFDRGAPLFREFVQAAARTVSPVSR